MSQAPLKANFSKEFGRGFSAYGEAHRILFKHGLGKYLLIPGLISLVYSVVYFVIAWRIAAGFPTEASDYPGWLAWMGDATVWVVKFVYWPAVIGLFLLTYKSVVQVVLSPVLSRLSEEVEHKEFGGESPKTGFKEAMADIQRALVISVRNLVHELLYGFLLGLVPVVGSFLAFGLSCYYTGFNFMDYSLERRRMTVRQTVKFVHGHRGLATGLGFMCLLGMMVPVIGWMIMPTYATVAATVEVHKLTGKMTGVAQARPFS